MSPPGERADGGQSRRRLLRWIGTVAAGSLAGCGAPAVGDPGETPAGAGSTTTTTDAGTTATPAAGDGPGNWSPPDYVDPAAVDATTVSVDGPDGCGLPGEVTVPADAGDGPVPTCVLVGGSGPVDLDGTTGAIRPYRDLAYGLATMGVATLRYTKRTAACRVDPTAITVDDEYTTDALAAIARVRAVDGTHPDRTVVVGHSQGARLAPRIAARASGVPGVVLLAAPGRPVHRAVVEQVRYLAALDRQITEAERARIAAVQTAADRIDSLEIGEEEVILGGGRAYWESVLALEPIATARELSVPLLLCYGERDYQVTDDDRAAWREGLEDRERVTIRTYRSLNHLFVPGVGRPSPAEYRRPGHVDPAVVVDLARWIGARFA